MSYFEPSRRPFERRRIGSWSGALDRIARRPIWQRGLVALLLALYVAGAAALSGAGIAAGSWTGLLTALVLSLLALLQRKDQPVVRRIALTLIAFIGTLALLLPAIIYVALGFWLLVSLPLWLYRG